MKGILKLAAKESGDDTLNMLDNLCIVEYVR